MKLKSIILIGVCSLVWTSCLKEEIPVPERKSGDVETHTIEMQSDYRYRIYYDLETGKVVSQHLKSAWDLGFSCEKGSHTVRLNAAKWMKTTETGFTALTELTDTASSNIWHWEPATGSLDSIPFSDASQLDRVYVLDAGYDERGTPQGLYKIRFTECTENTYRFDWAPLGEKKFTTSVVEKDSLYNQILFSFHTGEPALDQEPPKTSWDLVFTQFTQLVEDVPYLVTGALINPYGVMAYADSTLIFEKVNRQSVQNISFTTQQNIPGYAWKSYSFDTGSYQVHSNKVYLFHTYEGFYWKLHFTEFYNSSGQTGFPTFEVQRL